MTKKLVYVTTQFEGFHRWKDAPDKMSFLHDWHRHMFHVTLTVEVSHGNREIEFFDLKEKLDSFLSPWKGSRFEWSCEQLAEQILNNFDAKTVEVSEDGENGAIVIREEVWADAAKQYAQHTWGNWDPFPPAGSSAALQCAQAAPAFENSPQLVSEQLRRFCFVGVEAEGPNKGAYVLFVPGSCTPIRFDMITKHPKVAGKIERIYYGAGNDRQINYATLDLICEYAGPRNIGVDVEVDNHPLLAELVAQSIKWGFSVLQYIPGAPPYIHDPRASFFKTINDGRIRWSKVDGIGKVWDTPTDHPLFSFDIPIEKVRGSFFSQINR